MVKVVLRIEYPKLIHLFKFTIIFICLVDLLWLTQPEISWSRKENLECRYLIRINLMVFRHLNNQVPSQSQKCLFGNIFSLLHFPWKLYFRHILALFCRVSLSLVYILHEFFGYFTVFKHLLSFMTMINMFLFFLLTVFFLKIFVDFCSFLFRRWFLLLALFFIVFLKELVEIS